MCVCVALAVDAGGRSVDLLQGAWNGGSSAAVKTAAAAPSNSLLFCSAAARCSQQLTTRPTTPAAHIHSSLATAHRAKLGAGNRGEAQQQQQAATLHTHCTAGTRACSAHTHTLTVLPSVSASCTAAAAAVDTLCKRCDCVFVLHIAWCLCTSLTFSTRLACCAFHVAVSVPLPKHPPTIVTL